MTTEKMRWGIAVLLAVFGLVGTILIPWLISYGLWSAEQRPPEILLPLLAIAGVASLLACLTIVAVALAALNLANPREALGLPRGSVRALIALSLVLIFVITAMHLYGQVRSPPTTKMIGITQEQLADIPSQEIISSNASEAGENLFDVERMVRNEASEDFAQQILTTVSTLVVAVAGFYFGSRSVEAARRAVEEPTLRVLSPRSPAPPPKPGETLPITVETTPEGEAVKWEVDGDDDKSLVQVKRGEFEYKPTNPKYPVALKFRLVKYPDVSDELKLEAPPTE